VVHVLRGRIFCQNATSALGLDNVRRLIDEPVDLGFQRVFFTEGEPFILGDIYDMLAHASSCLDTTVLTNAMLLRGKRLDKLNAIAHDNLSAQASLDGATPEVHDAYRGEGTWRKTVDGIQLLLENSHHVCISTTKTLANTTYIDALREFVRGLGIAEQHHFVRPLANRGFSQEGVEVGTHNLAPEVTVSADGVYWHPLVSPSDGDMLVTERIFPLADAVECIQRRLELMGNDENAERSEFQ
jgi:MoaA/NifB/PqqE/SkfB family radical SAM enzyme